MSKAPKSVDHSVADKGLVRWEALPFLDKVVAIMPSIVYVYNQKQQASEYSNRSLGESIGYEPEEIQAMGDSFMPQVCHPDDLPKVFAHFQKLRDIEDGEVCMLEYRMRRKDGGWAWLLSYDTVFDRDDEGRVERHVGIATDVTKQKQSEADLEQLNAQLSEFAYIVTHDMKAPINNIMGVCQLLGSLPEMQGSQAQQLLDMILSSCSQATDKIADVVRVSQMASLEFDRSTLTWERMLTHVQERFKSQIDSLDAVIRGEFSTSPTVEFSRIQLESIVENLVGNALKYHQPGRAPEITLRSYSADDGGQVLEVRDNGIGIDVAQDGERIFGLFKRAQTERPGSGVGLYLVRRMIERAGGEVRVEGEPGRGAVFKLHFPDDQCEAQAA